jgi:hypothetical protein
MSEVYVGATVKMNPFRLKDAENRSCQLFQGERVVQRIDEDTNGVIIKVQGSNQWRRKNLLIKGVDYE